MYGTLGGTGASFFEPLRSECGLCSVEWEHWLLLWGLQFGGTVGVATWMALCPITGDNSLLFSELLSLGGPLSLPLGQAAHGGGGGADEGRLGGLPKA